MEEPTYECLDTLEDQCEEKLTTCSVAITNPYECTTVIEPFEASAFLVTVTGEARAAFAIDRHFARQVDRMSPYHLNFRNQIFRRFIKGEDLHAIGFLDQTVPQ